MITKWAGFVVFVVLSISCLVSTVGLLSWLLFKVPETASGTGLGIVALVTWFIIGMSAMSKMNEDKKALAESDKMENLKQ